MNAQSTAILISDPVNIRYLTGFMGLAPEEREAYCLLIDDQIYLFTSTLYKEQAGKLSPAKQDLAPRDKYTNYLLRSRISLRETIIYKVFTREKPIEIMLNEILKMNNIKSLEFEKYDITVAEFEKFQKELLGVNLVPSFGTIEKMRMVKSEKEIETIKKASALTDACFTHILSRLTPGVEEREITWEVEMFFHKNGASSSFSPIVAFNEHASEPHYAPENCIRGPLAPREDLLHSPSLILLDFGAKIDGYCADMTRVVFLGKPKDEWIKAYKTVLQSQMKALEYLTCHSRGNGNPEETGSPIPPSPKATEGRGESGMTDPLSGSKIDEIAKKTITDAGYPVYPHGLGHGVGLAIHEAPRLSVSRDESLLPGHVFSVEPGIYIEGKYGIRIEDLVVLTDRGTEILSTSEKGLTIL